MASGIDRRLVLVRDSPRRTEAVAGDTERLGALWHFPCATLVAKPLQAPHSPVKVAARDPEASPGPWLPVPISCDAIIAPTRGSHILGQRVTGTLAKFPSMKHPRFLMLVKPASICERTIAWYWCRLGRVQPPIRKPVPECRSGEQRISKTLNRAQLANRDG